MDKSRLLTFCDGVVAIIITIMVLELKIPPNADWEQLHYLWHIFLCYVLSFVNVAVYWNNHHNLMHWVDRVNSAMVWAHIHLLFWLSLIPFATGWMGADDFAPLPTAIYGVALMMPGLAYHLLIAITVRFQGPDSRVAREVGRDIKDKISPVLYLTAIGLAFLSPSVALAIYALVAVFWLLPDRKVERLLDRH